MSELKIGDLCPRVPVYEVNVYKADGTMVAASTQSYFVFQNK